MSNYTQRCLQAYDTQAFPAKHGSRKLGASRANSRPACTQCRITWAALPHLALGGPKQATNDKA
jgi:hypothetical protein